MIAEALTTYLKADPAVAALVEDRIYDGIAPATARYPLIQFSFMAGRRLPSLADRHRIKGPLVQIDAYALASQPANHGYVSFSHVQQARAVAAAVEEALEDFHGIAVEDTEVLGCLLESERELTEEAGNLARVSQDFQLWWRSL